MSDWINVEDRHPEDGEYILVVRDVGERLITDTYNWDRWWKMNNVTHWMPLPEPPTDPEDKFGSPNPGGMECS